MKTSALKIAMLAMAVFASAKAADTEHESFSERLAYQAEIDLTTVFLALYPEATISERQQLVADMLDFADSFVGKPYRRGAKGPNAFDCSGFTGYVYRNFGISLGASSAAQYTQGEKVDDGAIQPGDLVFFSGAAGGRSRVGHVGMVVDVDDDGAITFIHAAISGGIRYDVYPDGGYYSARYIGARRLINEK